MTTKLYDALTLEVERADALAAHLADRLSDLSSVLAHESSRELYALSLIAQSMCDMHARIYDRAKALATGGAV